MRPMTTKELNAWMASWRMKAPAVLSMHGVEQGSSDADALINEHQTKLWCNRDAFWINDKCERLFRKSPNGQSPLDAWARTVLMNALKNWLRGNGRRDKFIRKYADAEVVSSKDPSEEAERKDQLSLAKEIFSQLSTEYREFLTLYHSTSLTREEFARKNDISVQECKNKLRRIRQAIESCRMVRMGGKQQNKDSHA